MTPEFKTEKLNGGSAFMKSLAANYSLLRRQPTPLFTLILKQEGRAIADLVKVGEPRLW